MRFFGVLMCVLFLVPGAYAKPPQAAFAYRPTLVRAAHVFWGLDAPVATLAAQVHAESAWNANAKSPAGAMGLAQFMPATAAWLPSVAPGVGASAPYNPGWALRALAAYDRWLWERVTGVSPCERMAFALSAYNGGLGWVQKDKKLAQKKGLDPRVWFKNVEAVNAGRSPAAWKENRGYARRILFDLEPEYETTGWGFGVCE